MGADNENLPVVDGSGEYGESWEAMPVFDSSKIDELRSFQPPHMPSLIPQILQRFTAELEVRGGVIAAAVSGHDVAMLQAHAHTLKSSCAMLGAMRVSAICERIEYVASLGETERVLTLSARLVAELRLAVEGLRAAIV